jgi:hypothetical protein
MTMRYFQNAADSSVHGYDDVAQAAAVAECIAVGWADITGSWPRAPTLADLAAATVAAASAACANLVAQIYPDPTHQAAFANAASIVNGAGGAAPTSAPMAAKFAALAAVYGFLPAAFATLVVAMQGASFDLSAALATLNGAASAAATPAALAAALAAFETALAAVVAEIAAAGLPAVAAPAAISIVGVNA